MKEEEVRKAFDYFKAEIQKEFPEETKGFGDFKELKKDKILYALFKTMVKYKKDSSF